MLAGMAVRILKALKGPASRDVTYGLSPLLKIKSMKKDFGDKIKSLLDDYLGDAIMSHGRDYMVTTIANRRR
jgi:hypothetical protein